MLEGDAEAVAPEAGALVEPPVEDLAPVHSGVSTDFERAKRLRRILKSLSQGRSQEAVARFLKFTLYCIAAMLVLHVAEFTTVKVTTNSIQAAITATKNSGEQGAILQDLLTSIRNLAVAYDGTNSFIFPSVSGACEPRGPRGPRCWSMADQGTLNVGIDVLAHPCSICRRMCRSGLPRLLPASTSSPSRPRTSTSVGRVLPFPDRCHPRARTFGLTTRSQGLDRVLLLVLLTCPGLGVRPNPHPGGRSIA